MIRYKIKLVNKYYNLLKKAEKLGYKGTKELASLIASGWIGHITKLPSSSWLEITNCLMEKPRANTLNVSHDPISFLRLHSEYFRNILIAQREALGNPPPSVKVYPDFTLRLSKMRLAGENEAVPIYIVLPIQIMYCNNDSDEVIEGWTRYLVNELEDLLSQTEGSGFTLERIVSFDISLMQIGAYSALGDHVPYPKGVRGRKSIFNPMSNKMSCLLQCIEISRILEQYPHLTQKTDIDLHYILEAGKYSGHLIWDDYKQKVAWENIGKLENLNELSIFIYKMTPDSSVADGDNRGRSRKFMITLARKGSDRFLNRIVHLLLLGESHCALIKDFHQFVSEVTRSHKPYHCRLCLTAVSDQVLYDEHCKLCDASQTIVYPEPGSYLSFKHPHKTFPPSHVAFFDMECIIDKSCGDITPTSGVRAMHRGIAYSYILIDREGRIIDCFRYCGSDASTHFIKRLSGVWWSVRQTMPNYPLHMTWKDSQQFKKADVCCVCGTRFAKNVVKNRHHDHMLRRNNYLGACCTRCNLQMRNQRMLLPVLIHNMSYDISIILKELTLDIPIQILPNHGLKYYHVRIGDLGFLDTMAFMSGSLASIAKTHIDSGGSLFYSKQMIKALPSASHPHLLSGKQVFCYDYLDDESKLEDTSLPLQRDFFNVLTQEHISDEDYRHALDVWRLCGCTSLRDYLMCYLVCDVGMLADCFSAWRACLRDSYGLDCVNYVSLPGYGFDSFLMSSNLKIELISDPELGKLIRDNVRGGFTTVVRNFAMARNKDLGNNLPDKKSNYILYIDFNSLYAGCMSCKLPIGDIRRLSDTEMQSFLDTGIANHDPDADISYWLLIDTLPVSSEVAERTDELPLALNHLNVDFNLLSEYQQQLIGERGLKYPSKNKKLVASHLPQRNYLVSLKFLQLLMTLGLEIAQVHSVYSFTQKTFLEPFIRGNIERRVQAVGKSRQMAFKCLSNSIFGRCLLNPLKRSLNTKVVTKRGKFLGVVRNPLFQRMFPLRTYRVITVCKNPVVYMTQPQYIGYHILELAKYQLYHFWYTVMKDHYRERASLIYSDTDSFILSLETDDLKSELLSYPLKEYIDRSNFPADHELHDGTRKGQLGLLEIETGHEMIKEVVCLRPKMYSI
ncbi:uncharacterized protein LOC122244830 [Penaeus japonicus]|uniref:uncharacterized protein LOC122244830 n=1 Tax=Penaeus japonicus TaxID=27405 RepID=UPI001C70DA26|nr:uncharacterized protein LOC122244830 [Penaeus japonicus]